MKFKLIILSFLQVMVFADFNPNGNRADYVVIGVGTAGGLMVEKLTEDKTTSVIALHNGPNLTDDPLIKYSKNAIFTLLTAILNLPIDQIPNIPPELKAQIEQLLIDSSIHIPRLYIEGFTTPQPNANNRQLLWVYAIPEGGASSINAGAYCRGTNHFFEQWEAIAGAEWWSVDRITDVFVTLEKYKGKTNNPYVHGSNGALNVHQISHPSKLAKTFCQGIINATHVPLVLDYNDPNTPIGVTPQVQITQKGHEGKYRESSATAFLSDHVMTRGGYGKHGRNLRVHFFSTALKTIWDGNKAIGVEYLQNGQTKQVFANKGVVVCAGLLSSPFLLHSGIGPQALLQSLGIPVIFNNPNVGQNLKNQPNLPLVFLTNPQDDSRILANAIFEQISFLPAPGQNSIVRDLRLSTINVIPGLAACLFDLNQPKSKGSITIGSSNPLDPPIIDCGIFTNPDDFALYLQSMMTYIKDLNSALQKLDPRYELIFPDPLLLDDPVYVSFFIREFAGSNMHFQSHCRMAPFSEGGVVDSSGRVYGVENLIVADNSVNPIGTDGSPMATAYLVAFNIATQLLLNP